MTTTAPVEKEITRMVSSSFGKTEIVIWHEYENGDRWQRISVAFELDGQAWPPDSYLMQRAGYGYATAMSPEEWQADRERR